VIPCENPTGCEEEATFHVESQYTRTDVHELRYRIYFLCKTHAEEWLTSGLVHDNKEISRWERFQLETRTKHYPLNLGEV
jgi:hypothetical protein